MNTTSINIFASLCFALALLHTFLVKQFQHWALRFPEGSVGENFFHLLGEVEVVFGLWATIFLIFMASSAGTSSSLQYLEGLNFTEPAFVFVIMAVCSTRPILQVATQWITVASKGLPFKGQIPFYFSCLVLGPLLGSFITEPAAMTVTALILLEHFYKRGMSQKFMYATLGLLFVNISVGGTLTPFAAPPVLMVAAQWKWDLNYTFFHFGWRAILTILLTTTLITFRFKDELSKMKSQKVNNKDLSIPSWVKLLHLVFLGSIILASHHMVIFVGLFLLFLGLVTVTKEYQSDLKLRESLLVGFFLGGLVILGAPQRWWLEPLITQLNHLFLYLGCIGLTAITDNAALTYLGSQVPHLSEVSKQALVSGSVVGGGLTVIANAPNPAGYGILNASLGKEGISSIQLFLNALIPTLIAGLCFWP